jgi:DNA polymerase
MTDILSPSSQEVIRRRILSVVKSVKGQVQNAESLYVSVDVSKPRLQSAPAVPETEDSWHGLHTAAAGCERCALSKTRRNVVFGDGNRSARLVFVGEARARMKISRGCRSWDGPDSS